MLLNNSRALRAGALNNSRALCAGALIGALALTAGHVDSRGSLAFGPARAEAAVSVAYALDELVARAPRVAVVKAAESKSRWEKVRGSKRIVTYTRLVVEQTVYGKKSADVWVRTLGGAVGRVGQQVAGEPAFFKGRRSLVFLQNIESEVDGSAVTIVAGSAQGHFPIRASKQRPADPARLKASPTMGKVLRRRGPSMPIQHVLLDRTLDEASQAILAAKARVDAAKKP